MIKVRTLLLTLLLGFTVVGYAKDGIVRILAIGNSFSEDAVEQNLYELAAADGRKTVIGNMYIGGCPLELHLANARADAAAYRYRKIGVDGVMRQEDRVSLAKAIGDEQWDYISFQQASGFSGDYATYTPYLPALLAYVKRLAPKGCKFIWHQTWAYAKDSDHGHFKYYGNNQMTMYHAIMKASRQAVRDYRFSIIVPSGTAVQNARTSFIGDHMNRDGYHLDLIYGRYTAACTWYEAIFKKSVRGNAYAPAGLRADVVRVAQEAAHQAVRHPYRVTDLSAMTPSGDGQ